MLMRMKSMLNSIKKAKTNKRLLVVCIQCPSVEISTKESIENIAVYSLSGRLLKEIPNSKTINVNDLSSGVYIIKIFSQNSTYTKKFIRN